MSRKANKPIPIPTGVSVISTGKQLTVKGPKGELTKLFNPIVKFEIGADNINISVPQPTDKSQRAIWGTAGALVRNLIIGVTNGYTVKLEINGVGYGFDVKDKTLHIKAGFSHELTYILPAGVTAKQEKNVLSLSSTDKQLVGQVAAEIRKIRKPEPYKGKGIKYIDEVIIRKQGKQAAGATA